MPRAFFDNHVRRNYDAWMAEPLQEHLAKNAVADANNMAARVFHHWKDLDRAQVFGANNEGEYRNGLVAQVCPDFALVRDVADAYKHVELDRPSRRVTRADQTGVASLGWGEALWDEGTWGSVPELVVTLDDGAKRPLTAIMQNVMGMWERLLVEWGL
jgi:hypothetical protein